MNYKREKIPLKARIIVGIIQAIALTVGIGLWDYFKGDELQYGRYVFQGVGFPLLMSWMFRYKVVKEKK
ncbi:hypothetical protein [Hanstruepera marina]|uniref:hypothetical protein n=1 Tax=Hanstruepera marina TaxID=2873265 RepID=UPI001CA77E04|nr:hypothetical protein [Hanstruepera marina]